MRKIYFIAINWDKLKGNRKNRYEYIKPYDVGEGNNIAGVAKYHPESEGWRVYAYTTKKSRDQILKNTMKGEE